MENIYFQLHIIIRNVKASVLQKEFYSHTKTRQILSIVLP